MKVKKNNFITYLNRPADLDMSMLLKAIRICIILFTNRIQRGESKGTEVCMICRNLQPLKYPKLMTQMDYPF